MCMVPREMTRLKKLFREGLPIAEIARRLGRSRQTIYNHLETRNDDQKSTPSRRPSKLDPHRAYISNRLEQFDLPATVLLDEIREQGYTGGISILRDYVARIKARQVARLVERFETEPGRQAQLDFASCGTILHDGRRRRLSLIVLVLGYSRVIWGRFVVSERRPVLLETLEKAFADLGGVPKELLVDNCKQIISIPAREDARAQVQPGFQHFADHFLFETIACPAYWPRAKGKVERAISYIKGSFLEGRRFTDLDDLNAQLRTWLATVANVRVHGTLKQRPCDRFAEDLAAMLPIPSRCYPQIQRESRIVQKDARISYRGVQYSVDPKVLTEERRPRVEVHLGSDARLRLYHRGRHVGTHELAKGPCPPRDDPRHAATRREQRARPPRKRPGGGNPCFHQVSSPETGPSTPSQPAPQVQERPLSAYGLTGGRS